VSAARLILIAIILIVAALDFPKRTSDRYAQEMAAQKAITTIHTAEIQYYSQYGQYATSLSQLATLIDRDLAAGEKGGFKFVLQQTPTGYALSVNPAVFGTSGTHTYFSDQSMAIHVHNGPEPATANDGLLGETQQQQQQTAPAAAPPATAPPPDARFRRPVV
jgi:type IV pilus assembly protein PilA